MITVSEKTFVRLSIGLISSMVFLAFTAGMAWKRFETLEDRVSDLNTSFSALDRKLDTVLLEKLVAKPSNP